MIKSVQIAKSRACFPIMFPNLLAEFLGSEIFYYINTLHYLWLQRRRTQNKVTVPNFVWIFLGKFFEKCCIVLSVQIDLYLFVC